LAKDSIESINGIVPTCRYGHGDLVHVPAIEGLPRWALIPEVHAASSLIFSGHLFVCRQCGYTEFFDDEPGRTTGDPDGNT
jgi:hypothetical protein